MSHSISLGVTFAKNGEILLEHKIMFLENSWSTP